MTDSTRWLWMAGLFLLGWLLYLLHPILSPFLVGILLAYLGDPLVDRLDWSTASNGIVCRVPAAWSWYSPCSQCCC